MLLRRLLAVHPSVNDALLLEVKIDALFRHNNLMLPEEALLDLQCPHERILFQQLSDLIDYPGGKPSKNAFALYQIPPFRFEKLNLVIVIINLLEPLVNSLDCRDNLLPFTIKLTNPQQHATSSLKLLSISS